MGRLSGTSSGGRLSSGSSGGRLSSNKQDLGTLDGLSQYAKTVGLGEEVDKIINPKKKLSVLQRLGIGLSALNPAEAILTGKEQGVGTGVKTYFTGAARSIASAVTGTDYVGNRRYFKDVAEKLGVENGIAKFGIGFVGDVLLDPSTYFGGAIARGVTSVAGKGAGVALKGIGKVAPETEAGLRMAGAGAADAFGKAFKFGYKSSKGASDDVMSFLSKEQQAKVGLASSNLNRLGTGVLNSDQQTELALKLIAGKRAEFVARESGKAVDDVAMSSDPLVQKAIEEQSKRSGKFASQLGIENPYETYFPFIKKEKLDDFINTVASGKLQVGSEGYAKEFKNILTNEAIETNPAKAFFTSEAQQVSNRMTKDFLQGFVKKYGKGLDEFASADDALKAGYQVIKEKGLLGKPVGYVNKYDASLIRDAISPEFQTINMLAKATGFDAVTSLFKRSVTGLFAPFHVRNYMSGHIQNFEVLGVDALNPRNINIGQKIAYHMAKGTDIPSGTVNLGGKTMKFKEIMKPFVNRFTGDSFYTADFDNALAKGSLASAEKLFSKARVMTTLKTAGLGQEAIPFKVGRAVGQFIEHSQKATAYVTALGQGKTIPEALELATRAGFDYRQLTRFESQIMRRIMPFYSFTRKNIGLQLSVLGENPQRINQVLRFFENNPLELVGMNSGTPLSQEEMEALPDFIKESIGIQLEDTPEGLKQFVSSFGTPIEAFTQLFGKNPVLRSISQMNPILKAPIEIGIGKDSFRQRDLKDVYQANEYKMAPQVVKDLLNITEVDRDILKKDGSGKLVKVGSKKVYVADPERLLIARSLFTSRGISYLDQVFGEDMKGFTKFLKTTTGIKPQQTDVQMQQSIKETNKRREVEDLLSKRGGLQNYSTVYKPKGQ